jgi:V8-like Glu-specific endopeptidase
MTTARFSSIATSMARHSVKGSGISGFAATMRTKFNAGRVHLNDGPNKDERFLEYMVDTTGGQSGSPVFIFDSIKNQRYVVAIHTTGNFINRGVRVTEEVYDKILEWCGVRQRASSTFR